MGKKFTNSANATEAEYAPCAHSGCARRGSFPAPTHARGTHDGRRIWLCSEHIVPYNKGWNFFALHTPSEMSSMIDSLEKGDHSDLDSTSPMAQDKLRYAGFVDLGNSKDAPPPHAPMHAPEHAAAQTRVDSAKNEPMLLINATDEESRRACFVLGLSHVFSLEELKRAHRAHAKMLHPDIQPVASVDEKNQDQGDMRRLQRINEAYNSLLQRYHRAYP